MSTELSTLGGASQGIAAAAWFERGGACYSGLRLASVSEHGALFESAATADFWVAIHQIGLPVTLRWVVFPPTVIGSPGHLELYLLLRDPLRRPPARLLDELLPMLALSFPDYEFAALADPAELAFALGPFARTAWAMALQRTPERRAHKIGFGGNADDSQERGPTWLEICAQRTNPSQALFLLSAARVATALDWTLVPEQLAGEEIELGAQQLAVDYLPGRPPLAFRCKLCWSGSAGQAPVAMTASLERALGIRNARFVQPRPQDTARANGDRGATNSFGWLTTLHPLLPHPFPTAQAIGAVSPASLALFNPRLPRIDLPESGVLLGHSDDGRPICLAQSDRLRHQWIIGQTGTGKSTLLLNSILQDLEEGNGIAVFDPHGEMVQRIRELMPDHRRADVVFIDATDRSLAQPHVNILEAADVLEANMRIGQLIELLVAIYSAEFCGPMWQQAVTAALLLLACRLERPGTLCDVPRLFTDETFLKGWLEDEQTAARVPNAVLWWKNTWKKMSDFHRSEQLCYITSKFSVFDSDPMLRAIFGHSRSNIDLRKMMDERQVLLCNLSRGNVNPIATTLLIGVFMQLALNAALARATTPPEQRAPFFVYCDEFQRIAGPSTAAILSEVRKYNVGLVLAHQFIEQLPNEVLTGVLGNVGTKLMFRVGARDANRIQSYVPDLEVSELTYLPNFHVLAEMLVDGMPSRPFTLRTLAPPAR